MIIKELECRKIGGVSKNDAQTISSRTMRYDCEMFFDFHQSKINANSLVGILSMGLKQGDKFIVVAKGPDQEQAVQELELLFSKNFRT